MRQGDKDKQWDMAFSAAVMLCLLPLVIRCHPTEEKRQGEPLRREICLHREFQL
jgi:hypothetical protein